MELEDEYKNIDWLNNMLQEAKKCLEDTKELQKKYPESFGLKISIKGWKNHIQELENKIKEEKNNSQQSNGAMKL